MPELKLPEVLDQRGAQLVAAQLLDRLGQEVALDATGVRRLGGAGLEMLISAHRQWHEDGVRFETKNWPAPIVKAFDILGMDPNRLNVEVQK